MAWVNKLGSAAGAENQSSRKKFEIGISWFNQVSLRVEKKFRRKFGFRIGGTKPSVANSTPTPTRVRERAGSVNVGRWPTHSGRRHQKMRKSFAVDRRHLLIFSVYVFIGKKNETESSQTFKLSFNNSLLWNQTFQIWWFLFKSSPCVLLFFPWKLRVGGIQTQIVDAPAIGTDPCDLILYDKLENPKRKGDPHWLSTRV